MIKIIGWQKLMILIGLVAVNLLFAAAIYGYLIPQSIKNESDLRALRAQISTTQSDIDRMQIEFEQLGQQQEKFDALKKRGFFGAQERSDAKKIFDDIQKEAKVISAVASIKPGTIEENAEAQKATYKVLASPVEITVKAFDDNDIYRYIRIAEQKFPGHLTVDIIDISRLMDLNATVLRAIVTGENPELVEARIAFTWRTMIPESQVISNEVGGVNVAP